MLGSFGRIVSKCGINTARMVSPNYTPWLHLSLEQYTALPYIVGMQTVISTPEFLAQAKKLKLSQDEIDAIVETLADNPLAGDLISQTGGARKLRHAGRGGGKSGGYRTIHYFGGMDVPVFLLTVYGKGDKANLTKAERNELAKILPQLAEHYRATTKAVSASKNRKH